MKSILKRMLRKCGVDVRRHVPMRERPFDVLGLILERMAEKHGDFRFLQIGAFDGQAGDPIHGAVVSYGLRGILVEPNPHAFQALIQTYKGTSDLVFENCAIAWNDGFTNLHRFKPGSPLPEWTQQVSSFNRGHLLSEARSINGASSYIESVSVPTISIGTLKQKHFISSLGLLQIDTEGFDFEIIKMAFAAGLYPKVINYEHVHLSRPEEHACRELLAANDYRYLAVGKDTLAVHDG
jgi:FkbM family methyltransferase